MISFDYIVKNLFALVSTIGVSVQEYEAAIEAKSCLYRTFGSRHGSALSVVLTELSKYTAKTYIDYVVEALAKYREIGDPGEVLEYYDIALFRAKEWRP